MYRETIYKGRQNVISLAIDQGGELQSAAQVTRCQLVFKRSGQSNITIDSNTTPLAFSFDTIDAVRGQATRLLELELGPIANSTPIPDGLYSVDVYLFDPFNTSGVFWDTLTVEVRTGD